MTEEEKQNKKFAYQLACLVKDSAYCEFCPVSDGCNLDFVRDDVECYVRFFNWFNGTNGGESMTNKYGAKSREIDGHEFPSLKEADYYLRYKDMLKRGEIVKLELQPKFTLIPSFKDKDGKTERSVCYTADFRLTYPGGRVVVVEVKGYKTRDYVLRRKLFKYQNKDVDFVEV